MSVTRLDPPIPLVTSKGFGVAHFLIDYGMEHDLFWVVFLQNGECWTFPNDQIRACKNWSWYKRRENEREPYGEEEKELE